MLGTVLNSLAPVLLLSLLVSVLSSYAGPLLVSRGADRRRDAELIQAALQRGHDGDPAPHLRSGEPLSDR